MAFRNEASYSHSKAKMMGQCPLSYWRYSYGAWNGWWRGSKPPANKAAGEMYNLKHIETVPTWTGKLIHTTAEYGLKAAMAKRKWSNRGQLREWLLKHAKFRFKKELDQALNKKTGSPKHRLQLAELIRDDEVDAEEIWRRTEALIASLTSEDELWTGLSRKVNLFTRAIDQPERIILVEDLLAFYHGGVKVWLRADLIMRSPRDNKRCVIVDWKTGKKRPTDRRQANLYGAWSRTKGWTSALGVIVYIRETGVEIDSFEITDKMADEALTRVELFTEDLKDRLVNGDLHRNEPKPNGFEATTNPIMCHRCIFQTICEREGTKP